MKTALLIENAFWNSSGTQELKNSLIQAGESNGLKFIVRSNADFLKPNSYGDLPEAALFWDKDIQLAQLLEKNGLRLFNSSRAIHLCDDKTLTYIALKDSGLPLPATLICPSTYRNVGFTNLRFLEDAADSLGFPFVIKTGRGSFGNQVFLPQNLQEAIVILNEFAGEPMLFQRFVKQSAGRDLRIYVVGGEVVAAIRRENHAGDFRANIARGGSASKHFVTSQEEALALRACQLLSMDFAGVDLLFSEEGPLLCEVNSNAHFKALSEITGKNPADFIARLMVEALN
ncbi:MAG: RimK family alpha-L-glutamate ligase [Clostridiales bacterium]|nr:RimK family alpha-L-glutamate ligase [Clostridiales bacterium]